MKCPVCTSDGVKSSDLICPHCQSDMEAIHLTGSIRKSFRKRLYFGISSSSLLIVLLILWVVFDARARNNKSEAQQMYSDTEVSLNAKQQDLEVEKAKLIDENKLLKDQVAKLQEKKAKRQKIYIVKNGESLYTIARKIYGNGYLYLDLAKDNKIDDPSVLQAGQELIIYY